MKIWILVCLISFNSNITAIPCSLGSNSLVYRPNYQQEKVIYTFDTREELEEYLRASSEVVFKGSRHKDKVLCDEVVALYYGEKIEITPIYEEKKTVREEISKTLKGYKF